MNQETNQTETFRKYAETQLEIHQQELDTRYYNRDLSSAELKAEALAVQRDLFKTELTEKIEALSKGEDSSRQSSFHEIKEEFLKKLK